MENQVNIPMGFILEMDDVGWIDGRDYTKEGKASRSGLDRNHCIEDYQFLQALTEQTGKNIAAALVVGDWDKDNFLRGEVGLTHDPENWDQKSKINAEEHQKCLDLLENANVDYMIHGVLHGRYDEEGKLVTECEHLLSRKREDGSPERYLSSEDDLRRRLDMFFKLYNSWGLKQKIRGFVIPCGVRFATEETVKRIAKILSEYGIYYWSDSFTYPEFDSNLKVYHGVACFRWRGNKAPMPWDAVNLDPSTLLVSNEEESNKMTCLHGSHWTNYLNLDPKKSIDNLPGWIDFLNRQAEVFGSINAETLAQAVNQLFYHEFAKATWNGSTMNIDLSEVKNQALECHEKEFFLSVKKEISPKECVGGTLLLWEEHKSFNVYKIRHNEWEVSVSFA